MEKKSKQDIIKLKLLQSSQTYRLLSANIELLPHNL